MCNMELKKGNTISSKLSQRISVTMPVKRHNSNEPYTPNCLNQNDCSRYLQDDRISVKKLKDVQEIRLGEAFYMQPCKKLAVDLLGKLLVRILPSGEILKGRIVETECYLGVEDKASHSYKAKRTERNEAMFLKPGTAYVYSIYGMYYCFNISSIEEGSAVLIRAVEPLQGNSTMCTFRNVRRSGNSVLKVKDLCNGPSKLCQAFKIEKQTMNRSDLCTSQDLWLEHCEHMPNFNIISCKRIGIDSAGEEWANKPLRYYIKDNIYVSRRNKQAESLESR